MTVAWAIWVTGIPSSGKSWLAKELAKRLEADWLRLDIFRKEIAPNSAYSEEERKFVYAELAKKAATMVEAGKNVIIDATDSLGVGRAKARSLIRKFGVVQLRCSPEVAARIEKRHRGERLKGFEDLYGQAKRGEIELPGLNAPYLAEAKPLIALESCEGSLVEEWAEKVIAAMKASKFI